MSLVKKFEPEVEVEVQHIGQIAMVFVTSAFFYRARCVVNLMPNP